MTHPPPRPNHNIDTTFGCFMVTMLAVASIFCFTAYKITTLILASR